MNGFALQRHIYRHPPIQLFVSWVGGCRVWSGLFTGGGCQRDTDARGTGQWHQLKLRV